MMSTLTDAIYQECRQKSELVLFHRRQLVKDGFMFYIYINNDCFLTSKMMAVRVKTCRSVIVFGFVVRILLKVFFIFFLLNKSRLYTDRMFSACY